MKQSDLDDLAVELFDEDGPNIVAARFAGCGDDFLGSLSREHIETDEISGIRSVFLCPSCKLGGLSQHDPIWIGDEQYLARLIEVRGRAISAVILGK